MHSQPAGPLRTCLTGWRRSHAPCRTQAAAVF